VLYGDTVAEMHCHLEIHDDFVGDNDFSDAEVIVRFSKGDGERSGLTIWLLLEDVRRPGFRRPCVTVVKASILHGFRQESEYVGLDFKFDRHGRNPELDFSTLSMRQREAS